MREKLKRLNIWRPVVRRYGRKWALLLLGVPIALIIGGGAYASLLLAAGGGSINLQSGLQVWYKLNGNVQDSSPYNHNGTLLGSPSYVSDRNGAASSALGISTGSQMIDNAGVDIGNDWTISVWSPYPNNGLEETGHWRTLTRGNSGDHQIIVENGSYRLGSYDNTGGTGFHACSPTFNVNSLSSGWHNFTVTQSGGATGTMTFYVDGSQVCTIASYGSTTDIRAVGNYQGGGQEWGTIDDFRTYNRVLNSGEINALYQQYNPQLNAASGESGLVARWKLDGNAKDATPYADNGVIAGGAPPVPDREGKANGAYSFNGTNQYITYNATAHIPLLLNFTASAWIYINGDGSSTINGLMNGNTFRFYVRNNNHVGLQMPGVIPLTDDTTVTVPRGQWVHIAVTYDGSNRYYYLNGALVHTTPTTGTPTGGEAGYIGSIQATTYDFNGYMDDVRIYNRPLSSTEISNLYDSYDSQINLYRSAGSSGSGADIASNLVGQWNFTGNAKDATPYSNNGTVSGATLTTDRFGNANRAYDFDGTSNVISVADANSLDMGLGDMTMTAWAKIPTGIANNYGDIVGKGGWNGAMTYGIVNNNGIIDGYLAVNGPSNRIVNSGYTPDANWHFYAVTFDRSGFMRLYVDGNLIDSKDITSYSADNFNNASQVWIGAYPAWYMQATIDDVRIYGRVLSQSDIEALYNLN